jgi:glucan phosphoethanolaminetransferase (alkaline phosphatase superfamily)
MQLLTYLTFELKNKIQAFFSSRDKKADKLAMAFFVWLTLFLSKFIFLWVISFVFRQEVYISGFVGLFIIIIVLTSIQGLFDFAYSKLAD